MKVHSSSFKVVQFVFQNNEKWRSYEGLNGHGYSKNSEKVENLMSHFWEAIYTSSSEGKISSGYICPLGLPTNRISSKSEGVMCEPSVN